MKTKEGKRGASEVLAAAHRTFNPRGGGSSPPGGTSRLSGVTKQQAAVAQLAGGACFRNRTVWVRIPPAAPNTETVLPW